MSHELWKKCDKVIKATVLRNVVLLFYSSTFPLVSSKKTKGVYNLYNKYYAKMVRAYHAIHEVSYVTKKIHNLSQKYSSTDVMHANEYESCKNL